MKGLGQSLQNLTSQVLKDAGGFIRSIFVGDNSSGTAAGSITFAPDHSPEYYVPGHNAAYDEDIQYALDHLGGDYYRTVQDSGDLMYLNFDSTHTQILSQETIGNLTDRSAASRPGIGDYLNFDLMNGGNYSGTAGGMPNGANVS